MKASTYHGGLKEITNSLPFSPLIDRCVGSKEGGGPCQFPLNLGWTCDSFWPVESGPWKITVLHLHKRNTASQNPVPKPWEARAKRWGHREGNWGRPVLSGSWTHNPLRTNCLPLERALLDRRIHFSGSSGHCAPSWAKPSADLSSHTELWENGGGCF